jgi:hypothetical protein
VILIVVMLFVQASWSLAHAPQRQPSVLELLAVCLLVSAAAVEAVFWGCQASLESTLVLPALSQAKQKAWSASCNSSLRQLGLGLRMFADDNTECYP